MQNLNKKQSWGQLVVTLLQLDIQKPFWLLEEPTVSLNNKQIIAASANEVLYNLKQMLKCSGKLLTELLQYWCKPTPKFSMILMWYNALSISV